MHFENQKSKTINIPFQSLFLLSVLLLFYYIVINNNQQERLHTILTKIWCVYNHYNLI